MHQIYASNTPCSGNFADLILRHGQHQPWVTALITQDDIPRQISFGQVCAAVRHFRSECRHKGWRRGDKIVLMLAPSPELYIAVIALLAEGLVPVFIDRGLGLRRMLRALNISGSHNVIATRRLKRLGAMLTLGRNIKWHGADTLVNLDTSKGALQAGILQDNPALGIAPTDHGLISYTSGTTGQPKGADRTHASLIAQHQAIREQWPDHPGDVDMTCLPVLVLHNLCCGMPSVLPNMDFANPAAANGEKIMAQIQAHKVTRISGASAFLQQVSKDRSIPPEERSIRSIRIGGAPVGSKLARTLLNAFPHADIAVVYGSTEAEPIAHLSAEEVAHDTGPGYPVGKVVAQTELMRIKPEKKVADEPGLYALRVDDKVAGEVVVSGSHVLRAYVNDPDATRQNKVKGEDNRVWHRTGDMAIVDNRGWLRLLGRQGEEIQWHGETVYPFVVERQIQDLSGIKQAALVQTDTEAKPFLFISMEDDVKESAEQIRSACTETLVQNQLRGAEIVILDHLPVDSRHNSKIQRAPLRKRCR